MEALAGLLDGAHKSLEFFTRQLAMLRDDSESRECCICLEEDIPLEELCVLPCGHAMHLKCGGGQTTPWRCWRMRSTRV